MVILRSFGTLSASFFSPPWVNGPSAGSKGISAIWKRMMQASARKLTQLGTIVLALVGAACQSTISRPFDRDHRGSCSSLPVGEFLDESGGVVDVPQGFEDRPRMDADVAGLVVGVDKVADQS